MIFPITSELAALATGREKSMFLADLNRCRSRLEAAIQGKRILVIGGCGSIGAATVRTIIPYRPACLHVVDQNENGLAELVRDLRSRHEPEDLPDFRTFPIDFGSPIMERLLRNEAPYHAILNFAAIKHVRSEKDGYSILQMLDTNVVKPARLLRWTLELGGTDRYFCVSTDKAANPVNLMGASKRLMEHVIFSQEFSAHGRLTVTSARFANVAFSDGSLLQGWLGRLSKGQPLAVPTGVRRFFVSLEEAGHICTLAAFIATHQSVIVPRLHPETDLHDLAELAHRVMRHLGYEPRVFQDEQSARTAGNDRAAYPLLLTPLDTSGEKSYEEFVGDGESCKEIGLDQLLAVDYKAPPPGVLAPWLKSVTELVNSAKHPVMRESLAAGIGEVLPEFHHHASARTLDQRL